MSCFLLFRVRKYMSFTAKPPYSGLVVNVFNGLFTLPTIHRRVALWNVDLLKGQSPKISDYLSHLLVYNIFNKELCSLNVATPRKESSSLRHVLGNNQELCTSVLKTGGSTLTFLDMIRLSFP